MMRIIGPEDLLEDDSVRWYMLKLDELIIERFEKQLMGIFISGDGNENRKETK